MYLHWRFHKGAPHVSPFKISQMDLNSRHWRFHEGGHVFSSLKISRSRRPMSQVSTYFPPEGHVADLVRPMGHVPMISFTLNTPHWPCCDMYCILLNLGKRPKVMTDVVTDDTPLYCPSFNAEKIYLNPAITSFCVHFYVITSLSPLKQGTCSNCFKWENFNGYLVDQTLASSSPNSCKADGWRHAPLMTPIL